MVIFQVEYQCLIIQYHIAAISDMILTLPHSSEHITRLIHIPWLCHDPPSISEKSISYICIYSRLNIPGGHV
jgi:hypothetical protein